MEEARLPTIDLSNAESEDARLALAASLNCGCVSTGCFTITGHGVSNSLLQRARDAASHFFHLPVSEKVKSRVSGHGRGYIPFETERLASTLGDSGPGDLKESFNVGSNFDDFPWPASPPVFRETMEELFVQMRALTDRLIALSAEALHLPANYFSQYINSPKATLRATFYPRIDGRSIPPNQLRSSAHTDYGTFTIIAPDPEIGGLQVMTKEGTWHDVQPTKDAFVVNIGDIMELWTNGAWKATLHRVVAPLESSDSSRDRLSLVFLHNPNPGALISAVPTCVSDSNPLRRPPILAAAHLKQKSQSSRGHQ